MVAQLKEAKRMDLMDAALKETPERGERSRPSAAAHADQPDRRRAGGAQRSRRESDTRSSRKETTDYVKGKYGTPAGRGAIKIW